MKLLKKLMPIATVAATTACVVPMVSCGSKTLVSTSKLDYTPEQHAKSEEGMTLDEAIKDYFSTSKHAAEDFCYLIVTKGIKLGTDIKTIGNHVLEEASLKEQYDNVKYEFTTSINDFSISEQMTKKIDSTDVKGYRVSFSLVDKTTVKADVKASKLETIEEKATIETTKTVTTSFNNLFVTLRWNNGEWQVGATGDDELIKDWGFNLSINGENTETITYKDGVVTSDKTTQNQSAHVNSKIMQRYTFSYASKYLENVGHKSE